MERQHLTSPGNIVWCNGTRHKLPADISLTAAHSASLWWWIQQLSALQLEYFIARMTQQSCPDTPPLSRLALKPPHMPGAAMRDLQNILLPRGTTTNWHLIRMSLGSPHLLGSRRHVRRRRSDGSSVAPSLTALWILIKWVQNFLQN